MQRQEQGALTGGRLEDPHGGGELERRDELDQLVGQRRRCVVGLEELPGVHVLAGLARGLYQLGGLVALGRQALEHVALEAALPHCAQGLEDLHGGGVEPAIELAGEVELVAFDAAVGEDGEDIGGDLVGGGLGHAARERAGARRAIVQRFLTSVGAWSTRGRSVRPQLPPPAAPSSVNPAPRRLPPLSPWRV